MIKERPILFSTDMVQALLAGRKTQTRRIIKPQPEKAAYGKVNWKGRELTLNSFSNHSPYGQVGDLLWVREGFHLDKNDQFCDESSTHDTFTYKADHYHRDVKRIGVNYDNIDLCTEGWYDTDYPEETKWRPSIHMPKVAARLWLKVINVKVERLDAISDEDAIAEGIAKPPSDETGVHYKNYHHPDFFMITPKYSFKTLWEAINGNESWDANPWLWVVEFEELSKVGKPKNPLR